MTAKVTLPGAVKPATPKTTFEVQDGTVAASAEHVLTYGPAGGGKTRFVTSLPESWGKIGYFALDDNAPSLRSVLVKYRKRLTVLKPSWTDPILMLSELSMTDWKSKGFDTIIIDTLTSAAQRVLVYGTNAAVLGQTAHKSIGTPGTDGYMALPDKGDFGGAQHIIKNIIPRLLQQKCNVIVVCHEEIDDRAENTTARGGPAIIGKALTNWLPAQFNTVIHIDKVIRNQAAQGGVQQLTKYVAYMAPHGIWAARRNESNEGGNPMPSCELDVDPVSFWEKFHTIIQAGA